MVPQDKYGKNGSLARPASASATEAIYVGLDVHKNSWHATVRTFDQEIKNVTIPSDFTSLKQLLAPFAEQPVVVAYEAGPFGFWLHDAVIAAGMQCVVAAPSLLPHESGNRVKTDRRDSCKLADLLAPRRLKTVFVPTPQERAHREVPRRRRRLVWDRTRMQVRIKSFLSTYGHSVQEPKYWTRPDMERLHALDWGDKWMQQCWDSMLVEYDSVRTQELAQTRLLRDLAKTEVYCERAKLLRTVPGVGVITAMEFLLELQDVARFKRSEQLAAYVGLTPSQYSTGDKVRMGRITRIGKAGLRQFLVEAAWRSITKDPQLKERYESIKLRSGSKKAIVAIAHNLLLRMRRILLDAVPYKMIPLPAKTIVN